MAIVNQWIYVSLAVLLAGQTVQALVWSLVLGNPVLDHMKPSDESEDDDGSSIEDGDQMEHPRNTRLRLQQTGSRPTRHHHGQVPYTNPSELFPSPNLLTIFILN